MKIEYYHDNPNFGDALNPWLWPRIMPGFFDDDGQTVFLGIGSIIGRTRFPHTVRKILFGAAYVPEYHHLPNVKGPDWDIYFVRGPRTARLLGLPPELAVGDPAILVRTLIDQPPRPQTVSFLPHWQSAATGNWERACRRAAIQYLDPRAPVERLLSGILRSRLVIAESMHGAIVADALRVPWVAVKPLNKVHRAKWQDWAAPLGLTLRPRRLWPSKLEQARLSRLHRPLRNAPFAGQLDEALIDLAARRLTYLAQSPAQLSDERALDWATERMLGNVARLQKNYRAAPLRVIA